MKKITDRIKWILGDRGYRKYILNTLLSKTGYTHDHWSRIAQNAAWSDFLDRNYTGKGLLEISPGSYSPWASRAQYQAVQYPGFDICTQALETRYEVVIANQVFEHLRHPYKAARNVKSMLMEGGWFLVATPFLLRVHGSPNDFTRWTPDGLRGFLEDTGFSQISVSSWGNRACVKRSLRDFVDYGWHKPMKNEPNFPVTVWGYGRRL